MGIFKWKIYIWVNYVFSNAYQFHGTRFWKLKCFKNIKMRQNILVWSGVLSNFSLFFCLKNLRKAKNWTGGECFFWPQNKFFPQLLLFRWKIFGLGQPELIFVLSCFGFAVTSAKQLFMQISLSSLCSSGWAIVFTPTHLRSSVSSRKPNPVIRGSL